MSDNTARISSGYGRPDPNSPAAQKQARKQRDAAARFVERPDYERAIAMRDGGDPRFDQLPASITIALGYYESDRKAANEEQS